MEQLLDGLKAYILATADFYTNEASEGVPMTAPTDIVIGQVDLLKQRSKVLVSLLPDTQTPTDEYVEGTSADNSITVTFICRGQKPDVLARQMMRYAEAFKNSCFADNSLGGICDDNSIEQVTYYLDIGVIDNQATAAEITIILNKSV